MGRPKGSKNKPKNGSNVKSITKSKTKVVNPAIIKGTEPVNESTLFHWNETIQKLNEMKEKGDWTEVPTVVIDTVPENIITTISEKETKKEEKEQPKKKGKPAKSDDDKYPHCQRCRRIVYHEPWRADLNVFTGRADYHRQTPRYVKLCSECSMELSDMVDKWLLDGGCEKKFEY